MILAAVAHTRDRWPTVPPLGMVSFIDPARVRRKRDPGRCYRKAGFRLAGETAKGLLIFQMLADAMPPPAAIPGSTRSLFDLEAS